MSQVASASLTTSSLQKIKDKKTQPELGKSTAIGTTK